MWNSTGCEGGHPRISICSRSRVLGGGKSRWLGLESRGSLIMRTKEAKAGAQSGVELGRSFGRVERGGVQEVVGGRYTGVCGSRGNIMARASNSRHSAGAQVRSVVDAPVGWSNQVLPR